MNAKTKLKRFCFLGSFEPVYVHLRLPVNVAVCWPIVDELIKDMCDIDFINLMSEILHEGKLIRRDECLFVYAAYLASNIDIKMKKAVRLSFSLFITSDDDLFLFCKYATMIAKEQGRKIFSKTVRKAITEWYSNQQPDDIRTMWLQRRGAHGFTHKALIKLCHITDETIGEAGVVTPFFKTCTKIIKEYDEFPNESTSDEIQESTASSTTATTTTTTTTRTTTTTTTSNVVVNMDANANETSNQQVVVTQNTTGTGTRTSTKCRGPTPTNKIVAISKLRTTTSKHEAIKIIRKFKLPYTQVPGHLLRHSVIMEAVLPSMPYLQILKCWRKMGRFNHFKNTKNFKICKKLLENKDFIKRNNIHPIHLLMNLREISRKDKKKLPVKRVEALKLEYLEELYKESFNWKIAPGNLRMHITVNLQSNYKKKMLKNHNKLSYYDACMALCLGFLKREAKVDIFHWYEEKTKLKQLVFERDYTPELAFAVFDVVQNDKNNQRLVNPIMNALTSKEIYDVFLCIVPTAGRGNPKQNSDYLCTFLDKYRQNKNPKARFIILDLLKFKRSMTYSKTRSQNILEICGLDEHTTDLIYNFATYRFD